MDLALITHYGWCAIKTNPKQTNKKDGFKLLVL